MTNFLAPPRTEELFSRPVVWIGKQAAFYLSAGLLAGVLFVAGAGVYAYLAPGPNAPQADVPPSIPAKAISFPPPPTQKELDDGAAVASAIEQISAGKVIGAKVVDPTNKYVGDVDDVLLSKTGAASVLITTAAGKSVSVPISEFTSAETLSQKKPVAGHLVTPVTGQAAASKDAIMLSPKAWKRLF